jgi:predicted transcriptional regulator
MTVNKRYFLYEFIDKNPGLTIDELQQKIKKKWKRRRISRYANKLVKDKMLLQPKYFPTPFKDLINWNEMKCTKKPMD